MKAVLLLLTIPLFFLFLMIPVHAYATIDLNVTNPLGAYGNFTYGVDCSNNTGTLYCYVMSANNPTVGHWFINRFNATWADRKYCDIGASSTPRGFTIANATHVAYTVASGYYFLVDITNIDSSTTCAPATGIYQTPMDDFMSQPGYYNPTNGSSGFIYWGSDGTENKIRNSTTTAVITDSWAETLTTPLFNIRFPDESDNNTAYGSNMGWATYAQFNTSNFYKISGGLISTEYDNPFNIYGLPIYGVSFTYDFFRESTSTTWLYIWHNRAYRMNWTAIDNTTYSTECIHVDQPVGTSCVVSDSNNRQYVTNTDNCSLTYGLCPSGSFCSQLTPQFNVTNDLVENYTSCQIVTNGGLRYNCFNICFKGVSVFSNCVESRCKVCGDSSGGWYLNNTYGFWTNTYYSDQATVSVPSYTIACIATNNGTAVEFINETGNVTTQTEILTRAGNTITSSETEANALVTEDTSSYNYLLTNPANWVAMGVGGVFSITNLATAQQISSLLFSFIISIVLVLGIAIVGKGEMSSNSIITGFIVTAFGSLVMFTLMGWFPAWLMIILIVIGAYIMAKTMGVG